MATHDPTAGPPRRDVPLLPHQSGTAEPTLSVVIPALNESSCIGETVDSIPRAEIAALGWNVEILVVDNGSTDETAQLARARGARVLVQPVLGYGNAYKAGFANAAGDVLATGDADSTYPFEDLPRLLTLFEDARLDFLTTNRLWLPRQSAMSRSHYLANCLLSTVARTLFGTPYRDSQSGMWMLRREAWRVMTCRSSGMAFSQEIKNEAILKGLRCAEVPIRYRARAGERKLRPVHDAALNIASLVSHRVRVRDVAGGSRIVLALPDTSLTVAGPDTALAARPLDPAAAAAAVGSLRLVTR